MFWSEIAKIFFSPHLGRPGRVPPMALVGGSLSCKNPGKTPKKAWSLQNAYFVLKIFATRPI
jgi:hypothetical protein